MNKFLKKKEFLKNFKISKIYFFFLLNQYHYYLVFLNLFFNKFTNLRLKTISIDQTLYWTLFSYTYDKYYISINKFVPNSFSFFLKTNYFSFDQEEYLQKLINLKRENSNIDKSTNLSYALFYNFYHFNKYNSINDLTGSVEKFYDNDYWEDSEDSLSTNTFKFRTKLMIAFTRKLLVSFFNFKLKRQYRITKYINSIIKYKLKNSLIFFELTISNMLVTSKLVFNSKQSYDWIKNGFVYVNNLRVIYPTFKVKPGDNIQIVFSKEYFIYYASQFDDLLKLNEKYFNKFFKNENISLRFMNRTKTSKFLQNLVFFKRGIPSFLEVDFLTFSAFVIYYPFNLDFNVHPTFYNYNFYLNRLYNWKFLT